MQTSLGRVVGIGVQIDATEQLASCSALTPIEQLLAQEEQQAATKKAKKQRQKARQQQQMSRQQDLPELQQGQEQTTEEQQATAEQLQGRPKQQQQLLVEQQMQGQQKQAGEQQMQGPQKGAGVQQAQRQHQQQQPLQKQQHQQLQEAEQESQQGQQHEQRLVQCAESTADALTTLCRTGPAFSSSSADAEQAHAASADQPHSVLNSAHGCQVPSTGTSSIHQQSCLADAGDDDFLQQLLSCPLTQVRGIENHIIEQLLDCCNMPDRHCTRTQLKHSVRPVL